MAAVTAMTATAIMAGANPAPMPTPPRCQPRPGSSVDDSA